MSKKELDHLYLTKSERIGLIILFVFLFVLIILPWLYYKSDPIIIKNENPAIEENINSREHINDSPEPKKLNSTIKNDYLKSNRIEKVAALFPFDPNHLEASEARQLGISDKSYRILQKYLSTGAKIKTAQHFSKIYGIDEKTFLRLEPYIVIKGMDKQMATLKGSKTIPIKSIDINEAESADLITLPGIGEILAARIIKYRNLLGGFENEAQLYEIYGLKDSTIQKFKKFIVLNGSIKKINFNTLDYEGLKRHPYIGPQKARVICEYRKQHNAMNSLADLYKIQALDSNWINRISGYVSFE